MMLISLELTRTSRVKALVLLVRVGVGLALLELTKFFFTGEKKYSTCVRFSTWAKFGISGTFLLT